MRSGFVFVCVMASWIVLACGGSVLATDDEAGPPPETAEGAPGTVRLAYCKEMAAAAKRYSECTDQSAPPAFYEDLIANCESKSNKRPQCATEFEALTRCQARGLDRCDRFSDGACDPEEEAYADCVSGGACHSLGGGTISEAEPYETFSNHDVCECVDESRRPGAPPGSPPGGPCETWEDCAFICCPCSPTGAYTATVCDKTLSSAGPGRCASAEETCAATAWRCDEMLASKSRL